MFLLCRVRTADLAMVRIVLNDHIVDAVSSKRKDRYYSIGQTIVPVNELRCGYRYLGLVDDNLIPVVHGYVHLYIHKDVVPVERDRDARRSRSDSPNVSAEIS